jgi:hypothetical protein
VLIDLFFVMTSASLGIFLQRNAQSLSVLPVFLTLIGIAFCGLCGYVKHNRIEIKITLNPEYPTKMAD